MRKPHLVSPPAILLCGALGLVVVLQAAAASAGPVIRGGKARVATSPAATSGQRPSQTGYYVPYVTGPGGARVPVMQIPGSVSVVPRSLMDDQQATSLGEALRYVPGVFVGR